MVARRYGAETLYPAAGFAGGDMVCLIDAVVGAARRCPRSADVKSCHAATAPPLHRADSHGGGRIIGAACATIRAHQVFLRKVRKINKIKTSENETDLYMSAVN